MFSAVGEIIMRGSYWVLLHGVEKRRLSEARLQAHHALQWLARAARAYVQPQPDDGHTNLGWDGVLGGFTTFSSFGLDTFTLAHGGDHARAFWNVVGQLSLGLGGVWLGFYLGL